MATANEVGEGSKSMMPRPKSLSSFFTSSPSKQNLVVVSQQPTVSQSTFVENFTPNHSVPPDCLITSLPSHVNVTLNYLVPEKVVDGSSPEETISVSTTSSSLEIQAPPAGSSSAAAQGTSPIVELLQTQELAKVILTFVVPITTYLLQGDRVKGSLFSDLISISLCVGLAGLWNGILLRSYYSRKIANALEQLGVTFIFLAYFGLISSFLPPTIVWVCWVCFALSLLPFILSHLPTRESLLPVSN